MFQDLGHDNPVRSGLNDGDMQSYNSHAQYLENVSHGHRLALSRIVELEEHSQIADRRSHRL